VTPESTRLFAQALDHVGFESRSAVRAAGRAIFVHRREQREMFDRAFGVFWRRHTVQQDDAPILPRMRQEKRNAPTFPASVAQTDVGIDTPARTDRRLASGTERIRHADFASLTADEARDALAMLDTLRPRLPMRRSRRWVVQRNSGRRPARSRMLRASLRTQGEPVIWRWLEHPVRPRPVVLICDISGSMEVYSRLMLRFAHALSRSGAPVEVFVFGTRLTRITRQLAVRDADTALARVGRHVVDWNGGTRIGESLRQLNRLWVRRTIRSGAVVLIASDGWERGEPAVLTQEMARLRRACHRLYWLDPLASQPGFEPTVQGLIAALPHIDELFACASVASLEALADRLLLDRRRL
jgi:uncharacterized protein with von Willebrand factor type A (vWA) domain